MVAKLTESIVDTLEKEKIITAQLREHYIYACITLIERIVTLLSLLCISIGMGNIAKIIYPPAEGSTGTSLSTTFGVSKGKTYYFYTEPTGANNRTAGSFRVRC